MCMPRPCRRGGKAIDARGELAVRIRARIVDVRDLVGPPGPKISLQQIVRGIEAFRNAQRRRAHCRIDVREVHESGVSPCTKTHYNSSSPVTLPRCGALARSAGPLPDLRMPGRGQ